MYERIGHEGRRPSPFSWRIRYALAHKGVEPQFRHDNIADLRYDEHVTCHVPIADICRTSPNHGGRTFTIVAQIKPR